MATAPATTKHVAVWRFCSPLGLSLEKEERLLRAGLSKDESSCSWFDPSTGSGLTTSDV